MRGEVNGHVPRTIRLGGRGAWFGGGGEDTPPNNLEVLVKERKKKSNSASSLISITVLV